MKKFDVVVEVLNGRPADYLKGFIKEMLENGYTIQDSQVQWYSGTIEGVYVFVKELE